MEFLRVVDYRMPGILMADGAKAPKPPGTPRQSRDRLPQLPSGTGEGGALTERAFQAQAPTSDTDGVTPGA